jgi:hypothetical protein
VAKASSLAESAKEDNPLNRAIAKLETTISAGDVFEAEIQTSALLSLLYMTKRSAGETTRLIDALVTVGLQEMDGPEGSAYLRLLVSLGSRVVKRAASEALAELTDEGVYPPEWVTSIGRPTPGRAWRLYDITGDREVIVVTYRYENAEHALLVAIDLVEMPALGMIMMGDDADSVIKTLGDGLEPWDRYEPITVAEARRHIEPLLARADQELGLDPEDPSVLFLPLARSRVRRLPSDGPGQVYTAADRAAAVDEFLGSTDGADAGDPEVARFWAQVFTGYSGRVAGEPPAQVGPRKFAVLLLAYVTSTFTLPAVVYDGLRSAATAWVRWSAVYRDLDEAATEHLMSRVPEILDDFAQEYDEPFNVAARGYLRDLVASDSDVAWLEAQRARREFAVPLPAEREAGVLDADAAEPDGRAAVTAAEFARCAPEGTAGETFLAAANRVVEELWSDDPAKTWQEAKRLTATGLDRHDVIHALAGDERGSGV